MFLVPAVPDDVFILPGHPFHQHRREFSNCSRRQIWLVFPLACFYLFPYFMVCYYLFIIKYFKIVTVLRLFSFTVIDFCLARRMVCDRETNYQSLRLTWASKTNCNQRRGKILAAQNFSAQILASTNFCPFLHLFPLCQEGQVEFLRATVTVWSPKSSGQMKSETT